MVNVIPVPATRVNVSVLLSATTLDCPATTIVAKAFGIPLLVKVIVSDPGVVVIVMPVPLANVKISVIESATTSDCPATEIVEKELLPLVIVPGFQLLPTLFHTSDCPLVGATVVVSTSDRSVIELAPPIVVPPTVDPAGRSIALPVELIAALPR